MVLTRRTIWGLIGDLRRASMLRIRKQGRRHHYAVDLDAPLLHPTLKGHTIRIILGKVVGQNSQPRAAAFAVGPLGHL